MLQTGWCRDLSPSETEFSELIERYRKVETAAISDAMEPRLSAMDAEIKSVIGKVHIAGPALTVRCYPGDELAFERAIEMAEKGEPYIFGIPEGEAEDFVNQRGLKVLSELGPDELTKRYLVRSDGSVDGPTARFARIIHAAVPVH